MNYPFPQIQLRGLDPNATYSIQALDGKADSGTPPSATGSHWMSKGFGPNLRGDFQAAAFLLKKVR